MELNAGSSWPEESARRFTEDMGFPAEARGFPAEARGFPAEARGFPAEARGFPAEARDFPTKEWPDHLSDLPDADLLVTDSYRIDLTALQDWRRRAGRLMVIDDLADRALEADVILNQNFFAETLRYDTREAKLLLGPKYALVDPLFFEARRKREAAGRPRVLISFGGSDDGRCALRRWRNTSSRRCLKPN